MMNQLPPLLTERLLLRPATAAHLPWFYATCTNPYIRPHFWGGRPVEREEAGQALETFLSHGEQLGLGLWIIQRPDQEPVGFAGFWPRADERRPELLIAVLPGHRRLGYAREAARRLLEYAFGSNLVDAVQASCDHGNIPSQQMILDLGMEPQTVSPEGSGAVCRYAITLERFLSTGEPAAVRKR